MTDSQIPRPQANPRLLFNANVAWFFLSHRLPIARAARAAGYEVHVAADLVSDREAQAITAEGFTFHRTRLRRGSLNPLADLSYVLDLARVVRRVRPHLIHNVTVKPVIYGSVVARALGVPAIINAISGLGYSFTGGGRRNLLSSVIRFAYRLALRDARIRVIFQNQDDVNALTAARVIEPGQVRLIRGSGVDLSAFSPSPEPEGPLTVVLPARMLRDKGIVEFAMAARALRSKGVRGRFLLAGMVDEDNPAGVSSAELRRLEQDTGVEWLGHVDDMAMLYKQAHLVCLPSYREGLPKALIEACAAGRAIVTTDVPGCREVVVDGVNGLLVKSRDAGSLEEGLHELLTDGQMRSRFAVAARAKAEAEFDVNSVTRATLAVYGEFVP